jgi:pyruvate kinase
MKRSVRRTKIVATLGPATTSVEVIRQLIQAGMDVARLNFSHQTYEDHARAISLLRNISAECDTPVTILQDLQGPKVRVGQLPGGTLTLERGTEVTLIPAGEFSGQPATIPIDYPQLAEKAAPGLQVLLADGLLELETVAVSGRAVRCRVIEGGVLNSRQGVNFPSLSLRLPALTEKDKRDLEFGLAHGVDWISLSFVRRAEDIRALKALLVQKGSSTPIIAKIERPQAIEHLEEIANEVNGLMVARGDLGVEMSPEKVPLLQKRIIELCNRKGLPVITATQMLESMIHEPRPTRAEASDVANAIIDGTSAVMLSGETAIGAYPVKAVEMMARIAVEVEERIEFKTYPPAEHTATHALSEAANVIAKVVQPQCIVVLTTSGFTARLAAAERPKAPVIALTTSPQVYHALNLLWGVTPLLVRREAETFEGLVELAETTLRERKLVSPGDKMVVVGGIPAKQPRGTNFIKIHTVR